RCPGGGRAVRRRRTAEVDGDSLLGGRRAPESRATGHLLAPDSEAQSHIDQRLTQERTSTVRSEHGPAFERGHSRSERCRNSPHLPARLAASWVDNRAKTRPAGATIASTTGGKS